MLGINEPINLDLQQYAGDQAKALFAAIACEEIENQRVRLGGIRGGKQGVPLSSLFNFEKPTPDDYVNCRPWFEFLTDMQVIKACCKTLGISNIEFLSQCLEKLHPPNWEALFWMRTFLEQVNEGLRLQRELDRRETEFQKQCQKEVKTMFAKSGAKARHKENNSMKDDVFTWLDSNMVNFKSMDAAATAIAGKVAPIVFTTARKWVGQWKKNNALPAHRNPCRHTAR